MKYATMTYRLYKDGKTYEFNSEKDACDFIGVKQSRVSDAYLKGCKCRGYKVERVQFTTHHETKTRIFKIWSAMKERCYRKAHSHYKDYGGRGIIVCNEWIDDFIAFRDWSLKNGYTDNLTLDRIDVNGNYEPSNCRWVTQEEQANNRRNNKFVVYKGEKYTLAQFARKFNIPQSTVSFRNKRDRDLLTGV